VNASDFKTVMGTLTDYYGEKAFSPHARTILWRILSPLDLNIALRVVELVAEEHARMPTIAAIKKSALPFLRDAEQRRQRIEVDRLEAMREGRCMGCDFTGYVLALDKTDPTLEFSFRCPSCPAAKARRIDERIPEWSDELKERYTPVSFRNESHEAARALQRQTNTAKITKRGGKALRAANAELADFAQGLATKITHGGVDA
jgi:hypothetical protein